MGVIKGLLGGPDIMGVLERVGQADFAPVAAEKKLCLNFRWRKMCSACADVCPTSALDLGTLRIDAVKCAACGVCAVACPAGALTFTARSRSSVLSEIDGALGRGRVVSFSCDRCAGAFGKAMKVRGSIVVPCLSFLDEELILECYARGAKEVRLTGCGPDCRFERGKTMHRHALALAGELGRALGTEPGTGHSGRGKKAADSGPAPAVPDRRDFILRSGIELARAAYPSDEKKTTEERWIWLHRLPERRAALVKIAEGSNARSHRLDRTGGTPFAVIGADGERCSMCGACGALCPTGAIGTVELDAHSMLYFRFGWCTACLLCVKACPEQALDIEGTIDLGRVAERGRPLLMYDTVRCPECKDNYIPEKTARQCPVCKKQSEVPRPARRIKKG